MGENFSEDVSLDAIRDNPYWFFCIYLHSFGVLKRCLGVDLKFLLT